MKTSVATSHEKQVSDADVAALAPRKRLLLETLLRGGTCVDKESLIHDINCENADCARCKYVANADTLQGSKQNLQYASFSFGSDKPYPFHQCRIGLQASR